MKSIFIGNSEFVLPLLEVLKKETNLKMIITGKDRVVKQRKATLVFPEPKLFAQENHIPYLQPQKLGDPEFLEQVRALQADIFFVCSYHRILSPSFFEIPPLGTYNFHASLLPAYRGASPIHQTLLNGDHKTGITLQKINAQMDEGQILLQKEIPVREEETYPTLRKSLSLLSSLVASEFISLCKQGEIPEPSPQLGSPSYCKKITKEDGRIDFKKMSAREIYNRFRAYINWPGVFFTYHSKNIKIKSVFFDDNENNHTLGKVIGLDKNVLKIQTTKGVALLGTLQPENKSEMSAKDFFHGYHLENEVL